MTNFADRLHEAVHRKNSRVCVGLDPRPGKYPKELAGLPEQEACLRFCRGIIDAVREDAPVVKPQIAFFEQLGPEGFGIYADVCRHARERGLLVIGDVKRGDIGSTSAAYAEAHLGKIDCDAITVNPFFGTDGVVPFIDAARRHGAGIFLLVKTSNPSSSELQDLTVEGTPVYHKLAEQVSRWGEDLVGEAGWSSVGAVVGATHPEIAVELRRVMPRTFFLVPGYGAQGAGAADAARCFGPEGSGAVVNASRSIIFAWKPETDDWTGPIREATRAMKEDLNAALAGKDAPGNF